eukprot:15350881-Ditylum_brightwellii.AAC.1
MKDIVLYLNKNTVSGDDSEVFNEPPEDGWYSKEDISTNIPTKLKELPSSKGFAMKVACYER